MIGSKHSDIKQIYTCLLQVWASSSLLFLLLILGRRRVKRKEKRKVNMIRVLRMLRLGSGMKLSVKLWVFRNFNIGLMLERLNNNLSIVWWMRIPTLFSLNQQKRLFYYSNFWQPEKFLRMLQRQHVIILSKEVLRLVLSVIPLHQNKLRSTWFHYILQSITSLDTMNQNIHISK